MTTIARRGNHPITLDDKDIYCSNSIPFTPGKNLAELVFSDQNVIHVAQLMSRDITRRLRKMGTMTPDPYAISAGVGDNINNTELFEAVRVAYTPISSKHNFGSIIPTRENFRSYLTNCNKKFIKEELESVVQQMISSENELETEFEKRTQQMYFPFNYDTLGLKGRRSGFPHPRGYSIKSVSANKRLQDMSMEHESVYESKLAPHKSFSRVNTDRAQTVYEKLTSRISVAK